MAKSIDGKRVVEKEDSVVHKAAVHKVVKSYQILGHMLKFPG